MNKIEFQWADYDNKIWINGRNSVRSVPFFFHNKQEYERFKDAVKFATDKELK